MANTPYNSTAGRNGAKGLHDFHDYKAVCTTYGKGGI